MALKISQKQIPWDKEGLVGHPSNLTQRRYFLSEKESNQRNLSKS